MRQFIQALSGGGGSPALPLGVKFGVVTDVHYGDINPYGSGTYAKVPRHGALKLQDAVTDFNTQDLDFVVCLGDYIDNAGYPGTGTPPSYARTRETMSEINAVYDSLNCPNYMVLGNHDDDQYTKAEFIAATNMPSPYYSFVKNGFKFIVLDANWFCDDDSTDTCSYNDNNQVAVGNGVVAYVPPNQETWLENELATATGKVIVFIHNVMDDVEKIAPYFFNLKNRADIRAKLEASGKVIACFNGHDHSNRKTVINDISYFTMAPMTYQAYPANAYSIIEITASNVMTITGYGNQTSYP